MVLVSEDVFIAGLLFCRRLKSRSFSFDKLRVRMTNSKGVAG
jgi:hypothetical protein